VPPLRPWRGAAVAPTHRPAPDCATLVALAARPDALGPAAREALARRASPDASPTSPCSRSARRRPPTRRRWRCSGPRRCAASGAADEQADALRPLLDPRSRLAPRSGAGPPRARAGPARRRVAARRAGRAVDEARRRRRGGDEGVRLAEVEVGLALGAAEGPALALARDPGARASPASRPRASRSSPGARARTSPRRAEAAAATRPVRAALAALTVAQAAQAVADARGRARVRRARPRRARDPAGDGPTPSTGRR